ncbi:MAG TPA: hypothetical protein VKX49_32765 [Bryobacteraceae bacterium]|nr:hypothetical protein [Bryobacteraceae bacterium]
MSVFAFYFSLLTGALAQPGGTPLKPVMQLVTEAKTRGVHKVVLPHVIPAYLSFTDLPSALSEFSLLRAALRKSITVLSNPSATYLHSYLEFRLLETITGPPLLYGPMPPHVPAALRGAPKDTFVVGVPGGGSLVLDGVLVQSEGDPLALMKEGQEYLVFVSFRTASQFASFPFGSGGVFRVVPGDRLEPLLPDDRVALAFRNASLLTLSDVRAYAAHRR